MPNDASLIGTVQDVRGATITVHLSQGTATGVSFVNGEGYRLGQVGSFVRIPLGFINLYGIVSQVGAGAAPNRDNPEDTKDYGNRWLTVQLVGEGRKGCRFQRGISQHPNIDDRVNIVTEEDLRAIYGPGEPQVFVPVGHLANTPAIPALLDINKLVTRHSAIVGSTGTGKSTTVASLLASLSESERYPSARILVLDIHGEYAKPLQKCSIVYRISADESKGERRLQVPFWALTFSELVSLTFGQLDDGQSAAVANRIRSMKEAAVPQTGMDESQMRTVTADSPLPFCLHKLWLEFHEKENHTLIPKPGGDSDEVEYAYVLNENNEPVERGDAMSVTPPKFRNVKRTGSASERVQLPSTSLGMRQRLDSLAAKLKDPRFAFLFGEGEWLPNQDGKTAKDLDALLYGWIGDEKPITILDLSGIPSEVMDMLIGALLRILYDALFWARNLPEGGRERPLLIVLEEAHAYLQKAQQSSSTIGMRTGTASAAVRRIAKEGRKYGVGIMAVSQRPSEIDDTILSQCGTIIAMRLSNESDRNHVTSAASDNLKGLFELLPVLRTGEAIIVGEAVSLPMRTLIPRPPNDRLTDSVDPVAAVRGDIKADGFVGPGGWNQRRDNPDYRAVVRQWRMQTPHQTHEKGQTSTEKPSKGIETMHWIDSPESTSIARFGYNPQHQTLGVQFINGATYHYFEVPEDVFERMKNAASKGQYLAQNIKGAYRYARA